LAVSAELVRDAARQCQPILEHLHAAVPPLLPGFRARILDGNHLAATEHRIEELRATWAAPLPGQVLVVLDPQLMLATDVVPCEDGHAQERSLLDEVLAKVAAGDVWIADRNFCTRQFLLGIARRLGHFVIRQHGNCRGTLLGRCKRRGRCATGTVYEQKLRLTDDAGHTRVIRRITVRLDQPTRDGDEELHLLSNVPAGQASAVALAEAYRKRACSWS